MKRFLIINLILTVLLTLSSISVSAQKEDKKADNPKNAEITLVEVIYNGVIAESLTIHGSSFGNELPEIYLDGTELTAVSNTGEQIIANLPQTRLFSAGSYRLVISFGKNNSVFTFDITLGTQGPQGEVGLQGPKGDKGDKGDTGSQ